MRKYINVNNIIYLIINQIILFYFFGSYKNFEYTNQNLDNMSQDLFTLINEINTNLLSSTGFTTVSTGDSGDDVTIEGINYPVNFFFFKKKKTTRIFFFILIL